MPVKKIKPFHKTKTSQDLSGREGMVWNSLFNIGGHLIYVVAGFILPRIIDNKMGQELLGVWDFSWSIVNQFLLISVGVSSSVNRYVARYRVRGETALLNQFVSSVLAITHVLGLLAFGLTVTISLFCPTLFGERLGENTHEAQQILFYLGLSMVIQLCWQPFNGIITGCHQWRLQNIIQGGWHAVSVLIMIIALKMNQGLSVLAFIYMCGIFLAYLSRIIVSFRIYPDLTIRFSFIRITFIKEIFFFGGKSLIPSISSMLRRQFVNVLIVMYLGPTALALYARPQSLIFHMEALIKRMIRILVPTVSTLESQGQWSELHKVLITSVRYSFFILLPMVFVLGIFGGAILEFWMGPQYYNDWLPAILSFGFLLTIGQSGIFYVLVGMNAHGKAGVSQLVASVSSIFLIYLVLHHSQRNLIAVALCVVVPLNLVNLLYLPQHICRKIHLDLKEYLISILKQPILLIMPFAGCLLVAKYIFYFNPIKGLCVGGAVGFVYLTIVYWKFVCPDRIKCLARHLSPLHMNS